MPYCIFLGYAIERNFQFGAPLTGTERWGQLNGLGTMKRARAEAARLLVIQQFLAAPHTMILPLLSVFLFVSPFRAEASR